ncbi:MAG: hypothetical protein HWE20_14690 [Gammaproteobacteria bacterium]|nr:hypothetical protein [Gammaproteobacteria bacterium]
MHITEIEVARALAVESRKLAAHLSKLTNDSDIEGLLVDIRDNLKQVDNTLLKMALKEATND